MLFPAFFERQECTDLLRDVILVRLDVKTLCVIGAASKFFYALVQSVVCEEFISTRDRWPVFIFNRMRFGWVRLVFQADTMMQLGVSTMERATAFLRSLEKTPARADPDFHMSLLSVFVDHSQYKADALLLLLAPAMNMKKSVGRLIVCVRRMGGDIGVCELINELIERCAPHAFCLRVMPWQVSLFAALHRPSNPLSGFSLKIGCDEVLAIDLATRSPFDNNWGFINTLLSEDTSFHLDSGICVRASTMAVQKGVILAVMQSMKTRICSFSLKKTGYSRISGDVFNDLRRLVGRNLILKLSVGDEITAVNFETLLSSCVASARLRELTCNQCGFTDICFLEKVLPQPSTFDAMLTAITPPKSGMSKMESVYFLINSRNVPLAAELSQDLILLAMEMETLTDVADDRRKDVTWSPIFFARRKHYLTNPVLNKSISVQHRLQEEMEEMREEIAEQDKKIAEQEEKLKEQYAQIERQVKRQRRS